MFMHTLSPAPWTCYRTYRGRKGDYRSIISNELNHTTVFLDDLASEMWALVEAGTSMRRLHSWAQGKGCLTELESFVGELQALGLLSDTGIKETISAHPPPAPRSLEASANADDEIHFMGWVAQNGYLYGVHWEITYRCNEKCLHCYNPGAAHTPSERPQRNTKELTTQEAHALIDEFVQSGVYRLTLSGGEVTLRKDFLNIVGYARKKGLSVHIYSNGLRLTDTQLDNLADLWPSSVSVSVYSADAALHDSVTQVPGSFKRSVECLRKLYKKGIKTYLKSTQFAHTVHGWELVQQLAASLNAGAEVDMHLSSGVDGAQAPLALAVENPAELIVMAATSGSPLYVGTANRTWNVVRRDPDASVCGAGITLLSVDAEGNLYPCNSLPIPCGNFRSHGFAVVWQQARKLQLESNGDHRPSFGSSSIDEAGAALARWQAIRLRDFHECGTHERCQWCTKCPGLAMLEHGDPLAPGTVNCRLATARMYAAKMLAAGETRDTIARRLGVEMSFGQLTPKRACPVIAESRRGTTGGFDPKEKACESLFCGPRGVSTSKNILVSNSFSSFVTHDGKIWLRAGASETKRALGSFDDLRAKNLV